jgi:hypothetical protein
MSNAEDVKQFRGTVAEYLRAASATVLAGEYRDVGLDFQYGHESRTDEAGVMRFVNTGDDYVKITLHCDLRAMIKRAAEQPTPTSERHAAARALLRRVRLAKLRAGYGKDGHNITRDLEDDIDDLLLNWA